MEMEIYETPSLAPRAAELNTENQAMVLGKQAESESAENAIINAMTNPEQIDDLVGQVVEFDNYIASDGSVVNDDGEIKDGVRLVLVNSKTGKAYSTFSTPFYNAFKNLVALKGTASAWKQPMKIKVIKRESQRNRQYKFLTFEMV